MSKTFPKGGIHPYEEKELTSGKAIWNASIPAVTVLPLQQHIGAPPECLVEPGDEVREGQLVGQAKGFVSANVHSPVPGKVREIREIYLPTGVRSKAIVIDLAGEFDRLGKETSPRDWSSMGAEALLAAIQEMGIVGMGGATFPTHVKYTLPKGSKCTHLILNGTECEPYLSADHRLMLSAADRIVEGLAIVERILNPEHVAIGIEINKLDAIEVMRKAVEKAGRPYRVVPLVIKYPQGDEKQLVRAITGKEIPSGGLPMDVGAVVSNTGTIHAIYEAVVLQKPVIERIVTVSGGAIAKPANVKARVGTPIAELIEECGGFSELPRKVVSGGPMMGFTVYDLDTPITKGTSGILALSPREVRDADETACIQCGRCIRACPMGLEPTILYKLINKFDYGAAVDRGLMDCRECGCCGYSCPARIPLVQGLRVGKRMARRKKVG